MSSLCHKGWMLSPLPCVRELTPSDLLLYLLSRWYTASELPRSLIPVTPRGREDLQALVTLGMSLIRGDSD